MNTTFIFFFFLFQKCWVYMENVAVPLLNGPSELKPNAQRIIDARIN